MPEWTTFVERNKNKPLEDNMLVALGKRGIFHISLLKLQVYWGVLTGIHSHREIGKNDDT